MNTAGKILSLIDRREKVVLLGFVLLTGLGAALEVVGVGFILPLIYVLKSPEAVHQQKIFSWIYGALNVKSNWEFLLWLSAGLLIFFLIKSIYLVLLAYWENRFIMKKGAVLTQKLFRQHMHLPYLFHLQHNTADLHNKIIVQVSIFCSKIILSLAMLFSEALVLGSILSVLLYVEFKTTVAVLGLVGLSAFTFLRSIQKRTRAVGKANVHLNAEVIKWFNQGFGGIKDIKILNREPYFVAEFSNRVKEQSRNMAYFQTIIGIPRFLIEFLVVAMLVTTMFVGYWQSRPIESVLSTLTLFAVASFRIMPSIGRIMGIVSGLRYYWPSIDIVHKGFLPLGRSAGPEIQVMPANQSSPNFGFQDALVLRDVSFRYPGASHWALRHLCLTIHKSRSTAFVGPSGAGKSTLIDLILGLLQPLEGSILADGRSIDDNIVEWRRLIGYVPQVIYFCDDTIRRNIAFGLPDNLIDERKLASAMEAAWLVDVVRKLPNGLDTMIGERGVRLSGGERQRLGIARALYHSPAILILDEATSSLDYEIEREIVATIEKLSGQVTLIIVAHRLSTVKVCDDIYSLASGKLVGKVRFNDLIQEATPQGSVRPLEAARDLKQ